MNALNVIGQNISNVNTLGYKSARYTFNEALYTTSRSGSNGTDQLGGNNPAQLGYGSSLGTIDLDMSTKTYTPTGLQMDCMIDGDGFFILGDKDKAGGITTMEELQGMNLSRLGNFGFDAEGWLVDGNGSVVHGFLTTDVNPTTGEATVSPTLVPIRLPNCIERIETITNEETKEVKKVVTTDILYPELKNGKVTDAERPTGTEEGGDQNQDQDQDQDNTTTTTTETFKRLNGLANMSIDKTGRITGITQDNKVVIVGFVALAKVNNPNGVTHVDGRYYQALGGAGDVQLCSIGGVVSYLPNTQTTEGEDGQPSTTTVVADDQGNISALSVVSSGDTALVNGGLEGSGTDLATEISNMIIIQRGYQANTRIVTVTDSMLEELVNMKR